MADIHAPLRAGTDIVFLGGLIRYILEEGEILQGLRRPLHQRRDPHQRGLSRTPRTRRPVLRLRPGREAAIVRRLVVELRRAQEGRALEPAQAGARTTRNPSAPAPASLGSGPPKVDPTLQHPRCVFQILRRHYARYTPEMVEEVCGTPEGDVPEGRRGARGEFGARPDLGDLLRGRLDAAHHGRPDDPGLDDRPAPPGQHRPARRRDPGPPGTRVDPGLHRHPHPLQPPARLPQHPQRAESRTTPWPTTSRPRCQPPRATG